MAEIKTWDGCIHQTLTEDDVKDIIPSTSQEIEIKNDYCSEDILSLLKNLNVINIFEAGYTYAKHPYITHQVVMKWLREVHKIFVEVSVCIDTNGNYHYHSMALNKTCEYILPSIGTYDTYEEAVEAPLKYCLTKLI